MFKVNQYPFGGHIGSSCCWRKLFWRVWAQISPQSISISWSYWLKLWLKQVNWAGNMDWFVNKTPLWSNSLSSIRALEIASISKSSNSLSYSQALKMASVSKFARQLAITPLSNMLSTRIVNVPHRIIPIGRISHTCGSTFLHSMTSLISVDLGEEHMIKDAYKLQHVLLIWQKKIKKQIKRLRLSSNP